MNKTIILLVLFSGFIFAQHQNRLFWDGSDWNRIDKMVDYKVELVFQIKAAYVNGVQDGRLFYYLKTWAEQADFADSLYSETVDYLSTRELVRSLDEFYDNPKNWYVPVPSAIITVNMYAGGIPEKIIETYIEQTKLWINQFMTDIEEEGFEKLLEDKRKKHLSKLP